MPTPAPPSRIAIIGAGPAGLMAADALTQAGLAVDIYDAMPSAGRKFLMAGKGGMNITHAEPLPDFLARYGSSRSRLQPVLEAFPPDALRAWIHELGIATFVGTSGRVFPVDMKAAPLLRAWLHRLRERGAYFHMRHRWQGWDGNGALLFSTPSGMQPVRADAVVLALGGASWPQLGADGSWVPLLAQQGIHIAPLRPSNCGFEVSWSSHLRERQAGQPLKGIAATFNGVRKRGECVITEYGIEGSLVYAFSPDLRDAIERDGSATLLLDLLPDLDMQRIRNEAAHPRGSRSLSSHLQSRLGLSGAKAMLPREILDSAQMADPLSLAQTLKAFPLVLRAPRPLAEAISSAGGVLLEMLDERLMLRAMPGIFCAGEMLDWEAPTGGYLLTACFATGQAAGNGVLSWLEQH